MLRHIASLAIIAAAFFGGAGGAWSQSYPSKPIRLVVTVAAGGPIDTAARALAEQLQTMLGQPVIVDNRPGAGGTIGAKSVEASSPDGYTLLFATLQTYGIAPALYENQAYNPDSFVPVGLFAEFPFVFVVPAAVPAATPKEFIEFAKRSKEPLSFGGSLATPAHLLGLLFNRQNGLDITYIPYRGLAPSISDLISARTHMAFDALPSLLPLINEGKLKALAVLSQTRSSSLPAIPTMIESGYSDFPTNPWTGIVAPPGTPAPVVQRVSAALRAALEVPDMQARMKALSLIPLGGSADDFKKRIQADAPVWQGIVRASGAKAE